MWLLAAAFYAGFKWLTLRRCLSHSDRLLSAPSLSYLLLWPGMDPRPFLAEARSDPRRTTVHERIYILLKLLAGLLLLYAAARVVFPTSSLLAGWLGMVGTVLVLHFGVFHSLAAWWRSRGIPIEPLMQNPLVAGSLSEFWSRRWNRAFPDLVNPVLVRPLARRLGSPVAVVIAFLFSGLVHDIVISVPAGGGHFGPTIYFAIQGIALMAERAFLCRHAAQRGAIILRALTFVVIIAPVGLLFHRPFVLNVYVPFMHAIGAL